MSATEPALVVAVDDEPAIRSLLGTIYGLAGFRIVTAASAREGLGEIVHRRPDLVVLDLGLPDMPGAEVLRQLRGWSQVPVIVLSVRSEEAEKVALLELGADDYVTKPFGAAELLARSRAALRRATAGTESPTIAAGDLVIDLAERRVSLSGVPVALTRKEFVFLALLARHQGRILTHGQILKEVWGPTHVADTHYVRILVRKLRRRSSRIPPIRATCAPSSAATSSAPATPPRSVDQCARGCGTNYP